MAQYYHRAYPFKKAAVRAGLRATEVQLTTAVPGRTAIMSGDPARAAFLQGFGLCILFLVVGGCSKPLQPPQETTESAAVDLPPPTQYTAKQAQARLHRYLKRRGEPGIEKLWYVFPEQSFDLKRSSLVGSWMLVFEDVNHQKLAVVLNCWGEAKKGDPSQANALIHDLPGPIQQNSWVLDNTDALRVAVRRGAVWLTDRPFGGVLLTLTIKGRGIRPVWGPNGQLSLSVGGVPVPIWVDAETGALYTVTGKGDGEEYVEVEELREPPWEGFFESQSPEADASRSVHPSWWPRAYKGKDAWMVYNRRLLESGLKKEASGTRDASSWHTLGIIDAALGNWIQALDNLDEAVNLDSRNDSYRYDRAIVSLIIRDFEAATADLATVRTDDLRQPIERTKAIVQRLQRNSSLAGCEELRDASTNLGIVPLQICGGPLPVVSSRLNR